jgi:hypothetical protein
MGSRRTVSVTAERVKIGGLGKVSLEADLDAGLSYYERIDAQYARELGYVALEPGAEELDMMSEQE